MKGFRKINNDTWVEFDDQDDGDGMFQFIMAGLIIVGMIGYWLYPKILAAINWCSQTIDAIGNWFSGIF